MSTDSFDTHPPPDVVPRRTHATIILCGLVVASFGIWSAVSTLDIVSMATGEVVPSSAVKTIQHLEGGIVRKINVREGAMVEAGQSLVVLEPTASTADVGELRVRMTALKFDLARLDALARDAAAPDFPADLRYAHPDMARQALKRFKTRRKRHESEMTRQREAISQRRQEIEEMTAQVRNARSSLKLVQEQIKISEDLLKDNLTNRFVHLDLLKEARRLKGDIEANTLGMNRVRSALKEAQAELENIRTSYEEENEKTLDEARLNFEELTQRITKFEDSLKRTVVRSPVDGVIKTLHVVTIGGALRPGDPVVDIVPAGDRLVVEAKLPTQDIGYVAIGQDAQVSLASADAQRFGNLAGSVINVSPDTLVTPEGMPFYKVRIETESDAFTKGRLKYDLFPGMQVTASIQTGERTVLEYVLDPLMRSFNDAAQER